MKFLLSVFQRMLVPSDHDAAIKANPRDISAWIRLIDPVRKLEPPCYGPDQIP